MSSGFHLVLRENRVAAGQEWQPQSNTWLMLRVSSGLGYWRHDELGYHQVSPEDSLLVFPSAKGAFLASRISDVQLQVVAIDLGMLCGVLTVNECQAVATFAMRNLEKVIFLPGKHPFSTRFTEICQARSANALLPRLRLLQLFADLVGEGLHVEMPSEPDHSDARTRLSQLIRELPEAELVRYPVAELARRLCCSQRHFSRLFREEVGVSLREKQQKLRLERARQLLDQSSNKIIDVALEAGFQSLSLFNVMFKKRFKMTPSQWRARARGGKRQSGAAKPGAPRRTALAVSGAVFSFLFSHAQSMAAQQPRVTPDASAVAPSQTSTNATPRFEVKGYQIEGNTLLSVKTLEETLVPYTGAAVDMPTVKKGLSDLVMAYRVRGYATVGIGLPQQQLTNGIVRVEVTEGRLSEIVVLNNRYFSSNNVMRALPGLRTNEILNGKFFQAELDQANANRDRQIYPQIQPGLDPGTTTLLLKVEDRLPLHGKFELNNHYTPDTPELRINTALQYNNLWQREHSIGLQYGFTPQEYKAPNPEHSTPFFDLPLIAYYNAFYRLPLRAAESISDRASRAPTEFGFNPATRQFSVPPPSGVPELYFFANRSTTDSSVEPSPRKLVVQTATTTIYSQEVHRDPSITESVGFRLNWPLLQERSRLAVSTGFDLNYFETCSYNTNIFTTVSVIPPANPNDPPQVVTGQTISGTARCPPSLTYLPFVLRLDGGVPDNTGLTSFSLGLTYNLSFGPLSDSEDFEANTGSRDSTANFWAVTASAVRDQKIYGDWRVLLRADGQSANQPLISNQQYALGGVTSVRGYLQGEEFGDSGWRVSIEPRTPALFLGNFVSGSTKVPTNVRFSTFVDYGQTYLADSRGRSQQTPLLGTGFGMNMTIGQTFDFSASIAWPLYTTPYTTQGDPRAYFSLSAQF